MRKIIFAIFIAFSLIPLQVFASESNINCDNRYLTLVNPVRGRNLWYGQNLSHLTSQYNLIKHFGFPATWLIQYDTLKDQGLMDQIKSFDQSQEIGVLLEISENLTNDARVIYPYGVPWYKPNAVFLSGYSQSDRIRLLDKIFGQFKQQFGYYPKSVGAWWIDSYSLNYLKDKYQIKTAMIVADQKLTDDYSIWGQWWGVPYFPSKANPLTPASSTENKLDVAIIQWAQRDPERAFGEGPIHSNYSLQANDYIRQGKDTAYFKDIVNAYLDCRNSLGQITVGLETGIESVGYLNEYQNQLTALSNITSLQAVTMSNFYDKFAEIYRGLPEKTELVYESSTWKLSPQERVYQNSSASAGLAETGDASIKYNAEKSFKDLFLADKSTFLDRRLAINNLQKEPLTSRIMESYRIQLLIIVGLAFAMLFHYKKMLRVWFAGTVFLIAAFGLLLKSKYQYGWAVYYGPQVPHILFVQIGVMILVYGLLFLLYGLKRFNRLDSKFSPWFLLLPFGLDPVLQVLRVSSISGRYYFGIALDALKFVGISFAKPLQFRLELTDLPSYQAAALLRIDFSKFWGNSLLGILIYPFLHIILAVLLWFLFNKISRRVRLLLSIILACLVFWHIYNVYQADPSFALLLQ